MNLLVREKYPVNRIIINSEKAFSIQKRHQTLKFIFHLKEGHQNYKSDQFHSRKNQKLVGS
jgi:hypothetical protein